MIAQECGRRTLGWLLGISIAGILATGPAQAQQQRRSLFGGTQTAAPKADDNPAATRHSQSGSIRSMFPG